MRQYHSWEDVEAHMQELIDQKRPFRISRDGLSAIVVPLAIREICPALECATITGPNGEDLRGGYAYEDYDDFPMSEWEPVDLPEDQWKPYLE